jgi:hypothetical protein
VGVAHSDLVLEIIPRFLTILHLRYSYTGISVQRTAAPIHLDGFPRDETVALRPRSGLPRVQLRRAGGGAADEKIRVELAPRVV